MDICDVASIHKASISLMKELDNRLLRDVGLYILTENSEEIINHTPVIPRHHCGNGELLLHCYNVALLCKHVGEFYSKPYKLHSTSLKINKDLLTFCGLFHDLGKLNLWEELNAYSANLLLGHNISGSYFMVRAFNEVLREKGLEEYGYTMGKAEMLLTEVLHCITMHTTLNTGCKTSLMNEARFLHFCDTIDAYMDMSYTVNDDGTLRLATGDIAQLSNFIY